MQPKIWANSGDSHFLEPEGLWHEILPADLAERMPRSERISDDEEIVHVDGQSFSRRLPFGATKRDREHGMTITELVMRPPGARDMQARLADLDEEGVWAEVVYPSLGLWEVMIRDRSLVRAAARAENEWRLREIQGASPGRMVPVASIPMLDIDDAVAECEYAAEIGLHALGLPTRPPEQVPDWNDDLWEPLWTVAERASMVIAFHIGSDTGNSTPFRGPGGAILNYVETTFTGQRAATKLVTGGALDRHPGLRCLVSEGGSGWVPSLGDRMNEAYRQHGMFVRPTLSREPKEILFDQVFTSFQHDVSAVSAFTVEGYRNLMWGSDYPHLEGTYGHTQKTLHELFDDLDADVRRRVTTGTFQELFPHVTPAPGS